VPAPRAVLRRNLVQAAQTFFLVLCEIAMRPQRVSTSLSIIVLRPRPGKSFGAPEMRPVKLSSTCKPPIHRAMTGQFLAAESRKKPQCAPTFKTSGAATRVAPTIECSSSADLSRNGRERPLGYQTTSAKQYYLSVHEASMSGSYAKSMW
jgi:hypothetical protein